MEIGRLRRRRRRRRETILSSPRPRRNQSRRRRSRVGMMTEIPALIERRGGKRRVVRVERRRSPRRSTNGRARRRRVTIAIPQVRRITPVAAIETTRNDSEPDLPRHRRIIVQSLPESRRIVLVRVLDLPRIKVAYARAHAHAPLDPRSLARRRIVRWIEVTLVALPLQRITPPRIEIMPPTDPFLAPPPPLRSHLPSLLSHSHLPFHPRNHYLQPVLLLLLHQMTRRLLLHHLPRQRRTSNPSSTPPPPSRSLQTTSSSRRRSNPSPSRYLRPLPKILVLVRWPSPKLSNKQEQEGLVLRRVLEVLGNSSIGRQLRRQPLSTTSSWERVIRRSILSLGN